MEVRNFIPELVRFSLYCEYSEISEYNSVRKDQDLFPKKEVSTAFYFNTQKLYNEFMENVEDSCINVLDILSLKIKIGDIMFRDINEEDIKRTNTELGKYFDRTNLIPYVGYSRDSTFTIDIRKNVILNYDLFKLFTDSIRKILSNIILKTNYFLTDEEVKTINSYKNSDEYELGYIGRKKFENGRIIFTFRGNWLWNNAVSLAKTVSISYDEPIIINFYDISTYYTITNLPLHMVEDKPPIKAVTYFKDRIPVINIGFPDDFRRNEDYFRKMFMKISKSLNNYLEEVVKENLQSRCLV